MLTATGILVCSIGISKLLCSHIFFFFFWCYLFQVLNTDSFLLWFIMQLTLRRVMDTAKQVTKSGDLNEFSMVLLNNTLSLPLGILLIFLVDEVDYLYRTWVFLSFHIKVFFSSMTLFLSFFLLFISLHPLLQLFLSLKS